MAFSRAQCLKGRCLSMSRWLVKLRWAKPGESRQVVASFICVKDFWSPQSLFVKSLKQWDALSQQPQCCMGVTSINRQVGVLILGLPLTAAAVKREFGLNSQMDMTYASFSFGDICRLCKETSSWTLEPHPWTSVLCLFSAVCFASSSSGAPAPAASWCCVFPKIMAVPIETHNALFGPGSVCTAISR